MLLFAFKIYFVPPFMAAFSFYMKTPAITFIVSVTAGIMFV